MIGNRITRISNEGIGVTECDLEAQLRGVIITSSITFQPLGIPTYIAAMPQTEVNFTWVTTFIL